ncbi:MAG: trypsin-like peptidase domain-containing protein [Actinomycetes bacterium]
MSDADPPANGPIPTINEPVVAVSVPIAPPPPNAPPPPDAQRNASQGRSGLAPSATRSNGERRSEWRRSEKARRYAARNSVRFPIFTRSVLLWLMIFALVGLSFGASGAFWWTHFNSQISQLRADTQDFETRSQSASADIEKQKNDAEASISNALKPLKGFLDDTQTIQLAQAFAPSVYSVVTLDDQGRPSVGTAFSVVTSDTESLMLTSYTTVRAASVRPGPAITLHKSGEDLPASLISWDAEHDLALLRVAKGNITVLDWASDEVSAQALASRIFPVSGTGGSGATLTNGSLIDQSSAGFQHTAPLGADFQGGPIVNADGKVLGVASLTYSPLGYDNGEIHFSPSITMACIKVLSCGGGTRSQGTPGG